MPQFSFSRSQSMRKRSLERMCLFCQIAERIHASLGTRDEEERRLDGELVVDYQRFKIEREQEESRRERPWYIIPGLEEE
jgi:hypothetical protein